MNRILNVFRLDERNSGDWLSPPTKYFNFENSEVKYLDYVQIPGKKIKADLLIIGGGGLISAGGKKRKWAPFLDNWLNIVDAKSYILWGVGIDKEYQTEDFNKKFDLIGCRQEILYLNMYHVLPVCIQFLINIKTLQVMVKLKSVTLRG